MGDDYETFNVGFTRTVVSATFVALMSSPTVV